jgi:hypothetical protein
MTHILSSLTMPMFQQVLFVMLAFSLIGNVLWSLGLILVESMSRQVIYPSSGASTLSQELHSHCVLADLTTCSVFCIQLGDFGAKQFCRVSVYIHTLTLLLFQSWYGPFGDLLRVLWSHLYIPFTSRLIYNLATFNMYLLCNMMQHFICL